MKTLRLVLILAGALAALAPAARAADVYIAQTAAGADSGASCANAHAAAWFNTNAAAGNTYHLCGTFTGGAGANTCQGNRKGSNSSSFTACQTLVACPAT